VNTTAMLSITLNGSSNISKEFSGIQRVNFYDNNTLFMNFTFNFTNKTLDLTNVSIEKGANGTNNYIIISNLNITGTKTIYLNRMNSSSNSVCFRDNATLLLSELVSNCTVLKCPGTNGSYSCVLSSNTFIVSGFTHSALIEHYVASPYVPPSGGGSSGGGSSGGGSRVGSALVSVPPKIEASEVEEPVPVDSVVNADVQVPVAQETLPSTEQPKEIVLPEVEKENNLNKIVSWAIVAVLLAVLASLLYFKLRKKPEYSLQDIKKDLELYKQDVPK
jgi:hypothetical protein